MAQTIRTSIKVEELSRYGFKADGEYINWSKQIKDADKNQIVPGCTFEVELYIADSGKKYCNRVLNSTGAPSVASRPAPQAKPTPTPTTGMTDKPMTREDWDAKDRRISRQGLIQAAVQSVTSISGSVEELYSNAEALADKMLDYVGR